MENNGAYNTGKSDKDEQNTKRIAIIPARSGSKGLKDKNIKLLNGKPLMAYTIEAAINSRAFDVIFVSTDSEEYARTASRYGADAHFLRSAKNSSDKAGSWDAVREVIKQFEEEGFLFDEIMLLQPTSPLRSSEDIVNAIDTMVKYDALAVESLTEMDHSPLWSNTLPEDFCMDNFFTEYSNMPRQMLPVYYRENGAVYLLKRVLIDQKDSEIFSNRCYAYIMPKERSIDIDSEFDFKMAEVFMSQAE